MHDDTYHKKPVQRPYTAAMSTSSAYAVAKQPTCNVIRTL